MIAILLLDLLVVAVIVGPLALVRLALYFSRRSQYRAALWCLRPCVWPKERCQRMKAIVLCDMGFHRETKRWMRPRAFDGDQFRLDRPELLLYSLAEIREGNFSAVEPILTAVVDGPRKVGAYHLYLAEVLLMQQKDLDKAAALINALRRDWYVKNSMIRRNCIACQIAALGAWLLASCGRRDEAENEVQLLLNNLPPRSEREVAGIYVLVGEIRLTLGEWKRAQESFSAAVSLDPTGANAIWARRRLLEFEEKGLERVATTG